MDFGLIRKLTVVCVALHSIVLGTAMLAHPVGTLELFGWTYMGSTFFPQQSGVFLIILAAVYAMGVWQRSFAWIIVPAKATAVVFLLGENFAGNAPVQALQAAMLDGFMGVAVAAALVCEVLAERRTQGRFGD